MHISTHKLSRRHFGLQIAAVSMALLGAVPAMAQTDYPTKPITMSFLSPPVALPTSWRA